MEHDDLISSNWHAGLVLPPDDLTHHRLMIARKGGIFPSTHAGNMRLAPGMRLTPVDLFGWLANKHTSRKHAGKSHLPVDFGRSFGQVYRQATVRAR